MPTLRAQPPKHSHAGDFEIQFCAMGGRVSQNARKRVLKLSPIRLKRLDGCHLLPDRHASDFLHILQCILRVKFGCHICCRSLSRFQTATTMPSTPSKSIQAQSKFKVFRIPHANYAVMGGSDCNRELLTWTAWPIHAKITHERAPTANESAATTANHTRCGLLIPFMVKRSWSLLPSAEQFGCIKMPVEAPAPMPTPTVHPPPVTI